MLNLNDLPIPNQQTSTNNMSSEQNFPTIGLKSILQNSDLLESLLKPIASPDEIEKEKYLNGVKFDYNELDTDLSSLDFDELLKCPSNNNNQQNNTNNNKQTPFDHDYFDNNGSKVFMSSPPAAHNYGSAFLGPSLWEKNEIFQDDKFGVEHLDINEFLSENSLNEADIKFLDRLQNNENNNNNSNIQTSDKSPVKNISDQAGHTPVKVPVYNAPHVTIKVKDDSKINSIIPVSRKLIDEDFDDMSADEDLDPASMASKKFFDERLTLQPTLKKSKKQFVPNELKDEKYWARRKKNNVAAKRSRDTRRFKENQIVIAATYLEHDNDQLRNQLAEANKKIAELQARLSMYEQL